MSTIRYLVKLELKRPVLWVLAAGAAVGVFGLSLPGAWGVVSMLLAVTMLSMFPVVLLKPTPWCSDTAFWRTRPVSRVEMFWVKTLVLLLLGLLPLAVVAWMASSDLDAVTRGVVRAWAICWGASLLLAVTSVVAIGSAKPKFNAISWQAVFTVPLLSAALIAVLRNWFGISTAGSPPEMVSGIMLGAGLVIVMSVAAWLLVGIRGRFVKSMVVLLAGGVIWPWVALTNDRDFLSGAEPGTRELEMSDGESMLRAAVALDGLGKDEFFAPSDIWWKGVHRRSSLEAGLHHMVGKEERVTPLTNQHADFVSVVGAEKIWERLRNRVPAHSSWVPSENPQAGRRTDFRLPDDGLADGRLEMQGRVFSIESIAPFAAAKGKEALLRKGLVFMGSGVPSDHAIDVRMRLTVPVLAPDHGGRRLESSSPPELWGILVHEASGTAYGAVSIRAGRRPDGISGMLLWKQDLLLRFELPRLESALLGLDPEEILENSELHLFEMTDKGRATAG